VSLLGLAVTALASNVVPRWGSDEAVTKTMTTYTTVTTCPVTQTTTQKGT
jgi:hypothetical protein